MLYSIHAQSSPLFIFCFKLLLFDFSINQSKQYPFSRTLIGSHKSISKTNILVDFEAKSKWKEVHMLKIEKGFTLYIVLFIENKVHFYPIIFGKY